MSSLPSSKVYFNLAHEYVTDMMQRYSIFRKLISMLKFIVTDLKRIFFLNSRLEEEGYKPSENDTESSNALTVVSPYENSSLKVLNENAALFVNVISF